MTASRRSSARVALVAGVVAALSAPALAALYVAARDGFGEGDLRAFAVWSVLLGVPVAILAPTVVGLTGGRRRPVAALAAGGAGLAIGTAFTIAAAATLGSMIHAFSFPVLAIWAGAAALGLAAGTVARPTAAAASAPPRARRVVGMVALALVATATAPFALILIAGTLFVLVNRPEPEVHLVPAGHEGPVVIVYDVPDGVPLRREDGARVLEIPAGGMLRTRDGITRVETAASTYQYVDALGRRTPLPRVRSCDVVLPGDPVRVCPMPVVVTFTAADAARGETQPAPAPTYESYIVGRASAHAALQARWDSVVQAMLDAPRPAG